MQLRDLNVCHLSDRIFPARIEAGAQRGSGRKSKKSKTIHQFVFTLDQCGPTMDVDQEHQQGGRGFG